MRRLVLIDGNSLFYRAYHALPTTLTNHFREPVNAVYGFSNMLLKAIVDLKASYMAVAFDTAAPTFRHIELETYKATRPAPPPDLFPQLPKVKAVLAAFDVPIFEVDGYEADDVIATLTTWALSNGKKIDEVAIVTGDRDTLQLVNDKVRVYASGHKIGETIIYDKAKVEEKFGVKPTQMNDWKALSGDPSDNISGVSGVGPKTATILLQQFGDLEGIYKKLDKIPENLRQKLTVGRQAAFQARSMVILDRHTPVRQVKLDDLKLEIDWDKVKSEFEKLGFKSLVAKLPVQNSHINNQKTGNDQSELI